MGPQIPGDNEKSHILDFDLELDQIYRSGGFSTLPGTDPPASRVVDSSNNEEDDSIEIWKKKLEQTRIAGNSSSHSTCNEDVSRDFVECYCLPIDLETLLPIYHAEKDNQRSLTCNMLSLPDNNGLHMRMKIIQWLSSYALSTNLLVFISCNIWSSISSVIHVPPLHKKWDDRLSIWPSLLRLSGFMVFICAVAAMVLVRAPFTSMQKSMLIFWAILLHLQSANSIIDVYLTLVLALLVIWHAFGKKQPPDEDVINKYANKLPICQSF